MKKIILAILTTLTLSLTTFPVFADSPADIVYVVDSTNQGIVHSLCDNTGDVSCNGYSYLKIEYSEAINLNAYWQLNLDSQLIRQYVPKTHYNQVLSLTNPTKVGYQVANDILSSGQTMTLTLSASQGCPSCPTPEPCPDPDEPFIVGLFREGFWGVATAVVALIVPIVALFLVFRLIHDFFWGRG